MATHLHQTEVARMWSRPSRPWRHEEVTQMPTVPTPATLPSFSQPVPMASAEVLYDQLTKKGETQAWFTGRSELYVSVTWKWTAVALQFLSGTSLKCSGEWKPSQWQELWPVHLVITLFRRRNEPDMWLYTDSDMWLSKLWPVVWLDDQKKKTWEENWGQKIWGKKFVGRPH